MSITPYLLSFFAKYKSLSSSINVNPSYCNDTLVVPSFPTIPTLSFLFAINTFLCGT